MGHYSAYARYAGLLPVWPPIHDGVPPIGHECVPVIKAACSNCKRTYQWCEASFETVRAICNATWVCSDCGEGP